MAESHSMTYEGFLTITLTALAVILAALAIGIGIAAIWGYRSIADEATKKAELAAEKKLAEYFAGGEIGTKLRAEIDRRMTAEADQLYQDLTLSGADIPTRTAKGAEPVAEQYPGEDEEKGGRS